MHAKHPEIAAKWDAEIRAKKKVSKSMSSVSYWGVDHGEDIEKALNFGAGAAKVGGTLKKIGQPAMAKAKPAVQAAGGRVKRFGQTAAASAPAQAAAGGIKNAAAAGQKKFGNFAEKHPVGAGAALGGAIGGGTSAAIAAPFLAYNRSKYGQKQQFAKSYWGVDHVEVSKLNKNSDNYKALVWNKDVVGGTPQAKSNRKIQRRESLKGQLKGMAAGAAAGGAAVTAVKYGKGARAGYKASAALGELSTKGARARTAHSIGSLNARPNIHTGIGAAAGSAVGQSVGDYRGRKKALRDPNWKKRID